MTDADRITRLEHRVRELQTAVAAIVQHFGIEREIAGLERASLEEIRLAGEGEVPVRRLIELYSAPRHE